MLGFLRRLFSREGAGLTAEELARRLDLSLQQLREFRPSYRTFTIPKRSGGVRTISAPDVELKRLQRRILRRVLGRLRSHPAATGFERGHSIVTNALPHVNRAVVVHLDLQNFFTSTSDKRVRAYFRGIGWNREAAGLLCRIVTHEGSLPQGAPTSPRLSNLVNYRLDARLEKMARSLGAAYSRYADDMTFSLPTSVGDQHPRPANELIWMCKRIVKQEGYALHLHKKLRISRRHQRQRVTGLVVNQKVSLPHLTRRRLRAIEHRLRTTGKATLTERQLAGWRALQRMIATQSAGDSRKSADGSGEK